MARHLKRASDFGKRKSTFLQSPRLEEGGKGVTPLAPLVAMLSVSVADPGDDDNDDDDYDGIDDVGNDDADVNVDDGDHACGVDGGWRTTLARTTGAAGLSSKGCGSAVWESSPCSLAVPSLSNMDPAERGPWQVQ